MRRISLRTEKRSKENINAIRSASDEKTNKTRIPIANARKATSSRLISVHSHRVC